MKTLALAIILMSGASASPAGRSHQGMMQALPPLPSQTGIVTGRILSTGGLPAAGVRVAAQLVRDSNAPTAGAVVFASIGETDSNGQYRLANIPSGRYHIMAGLINLPTYFPGRPFLEEAAIVFVRPGETIDRLDFTLMQSAGVTVTGRVTGSSPVSAPSVPGLRVMMFSTGNRVLDTAVKPDGDFEFLRVPPGTYTLQVLPTNYAPGTKTVVVASKNVTGIEFTGPRLVKGQVIVENGDFRNIGDSAAILRMEAVSNGPNSVTVVAPIRPDGTFSFSLRPGPYSIALTGQLFGAYRKSIVYGATDLLRAPLLLVDSASTEIAVTLTATRPESEAPGVLVSGRVPNVPRLGTPGPLSVAMSGTRTDGTRVGGQIPLRADGTFEFSDVPPGSYAARVAGLGVASGLSTPVAVAKKDVTGLALAMMLRLKVSGNIRIVDINGRSLPEIPADAAIYFRNGASFSLASIRADGTFTSDLPEGDYAVSFRVPAGYATKSISLGALDLMKEPLRISSPGTPVGIVGTLELREPPAR